jgi:signal transduction histidine kinase
VETLADGLRQARQQCFDVVLLDLTLPDSSGSATFLRMQKEGPPLPIVVMTSIDDEAMGLEAVRHGIQDYLIKGQSQGRQIARAIRYAIERKLAEDNLKLAEAKLQGQRDELETRVQQRTADLSALNEVLNAEILQRKKAETAHQLVRRHLAEAQETERGRISRELHDRLGQDLTALKLGLQNLRRQNSPAPAAGEDLSKLEKMAEGLMREIHRLAWELRPPVLDDMGLDRALHRYAEEWSETTGVPVDLHTAADFENYRLPHEFETVLYRIAQEALTNVARHAQAKRVSVLLERRPGYVSLIIEDDGCGFDARDVMNAPPGPEKLGLLGMEERVKLAGGTLTIESTAQAGATVIARLPLANGTKSENIG